MFRWKPQPATNTVPAIPTLAGLCPVSPPTDGPTEPQRLYPWPTLRRMGAVNNQEFWHALDEKGTPAAVLMVSGRRSRRIAREAYTRAIRASWQANSLSMEAKAPDRRMQHWLMASVAVLTVAAVLWLVISRSIHGGWATDWQGTGKRGQIAYGTTATLFVVTALLPALPLLFICFRSLRRCHLAGIRLDSQGIAASMTYGADVTIRWDEIRSLSCANHVVRLRLADGQRIWLGWVPTSIQPVLRMIQKELVPESRRQEYRAKLERRAGLAVLTVVGSMATGAGFDYFNYDPANPAPARRAAGWIFLLGAVIASALFVGPGIIERLEARSKRKDRRRHRHSMPRT